MKRTIDILKKMKEEAERSFINNSLIKRNTNYGEVPDTDSYLDQIAEFEQAIDILGNIKATDIEAQAETAENLCEGVDEWNGGAEEQSILLQSKTSRRENNIKHLKWIHDRLLHVHKENFNLDYMIRLREIIEEM